MMINFFVVNAIFNNYQANAFCDEICSLLAENITDFPSCLALSGRGSDVLQNDLNIQIQNIIFRIDDWSKYLILSEKLTLLSIRNYQKFEEMLTFTYIAGNINLCFEIWFSKTTLNRVLKNNIYLEHFQSIPKNFL